MSNYNTSSLSLAHFSRAPKVWWTMGNGNWNDVGIWSTNSRSPVRLPSVNDIVNICHNITINQNSTIGFLNVFHHARLAYDNVVRTLTLNNGCKIDGILDMSTNNQGHVLVLLAIDNIINNDLFITGTGSIITYARNGDNQNVLNLSYRNLTTTNRGTKSIHHDLVVLSNTTVSQFATLSVLNTNTITFNGLVTISSSATLSVLNTNTITFNGLVTISSSATLDFSGNPNVVFKNGWNGDTSFFISGTGDILFDGSQTLNMNFKNWSFNGPVRISNNSIITLTSPSINSVFKVNSTLEGLNSVSEFRLSSFGQLHLNNSPLVMNTGILNYLSPNATLGHTSNGNYELPYTEYTRLLLTGNGVKTLKNNTNITTNFICNRFNSSILDCLNYNLNVTGTSQDVFIIKKLQAGLITFSNVFNGMNNAFDFVGGSGVEVEFRNGSANDSTYSTVGALLKLTTNNQTLDSQQSYSSRVYGNILIDNNITATTIGLHIMSGILDGNGTNSIFDNRGSVNHINSTQPMATGQLQTNNAANTFRYNRAGNQDVKGGTYRTLEFGGSGVKRLLGNVVINQTAGGSRIDSGSATVDLNGFTITFI